MEKDNKNKKESYIVYAILFVTILVLAGITITYAYLQAETTNSNTFGSVNATMDCLDISYSEINTIDLDYNYPISDDYALANVTPVTITITNNCTNNLEAIPYTLAITSLSNSTGFISDDKIRTFVTGKIGTNNEKTIINTKYLNLLSHLTSGNTYNYLINDLNNRERINLYTNKTTYVIARNTIENSDVHTYNVYLWVDYYEGDTTHTGLNDNSTEGQNFAAAISLVINEKEINSSGGLRFGETYALFDMNMPGLEYIFYEDGSIVMSYAGETMTMPAGSFTVDGLDILADGEVAGSILSNGNIMMMNPDAGLIFMIQPQASPIRFGETYVDSTGIEYILNEDGSGAVIMDGSIIQEFHAGVFTLNGLYISADGQVVGFCLYDGSIAYMAGTVLRVKSSGPSPIKFGETYVDPTGIEYILNEDGSGTVIMDGSIIQEIPAGLFTFDGLDIFAAGELYGFISADGEVAWLSNPDNPEEPVMLFHKSS